MKGCSKNDRISNDTIRQDLWESFEQLNRGVSYEVESACLLLDKFYMHRKVKVIWEGHIKDSLVVEVGILDASPNPWKKKEEPFLSTILKIK